ncbi:MAG: cell division protein SepF [Leptolyngbyaceae bacterium]|nr:cell division protein SepF [Leptolyngbyaceae bacterium]
MSNIFGKLRDFVGLNEPADYDYEYDEMDGGEYQNLYQQENSDVVQAEESPRRRLSRRATMGPEPGSNALNNVIGMPGALNGMSEVVVMEPRSFEEMPNVIRALRERKSVVLNLTMMDAEQAQRSVDFVAGGTYAIDGHQERIGESIFLFTPNCVQVSTPVGTMNQPPVMQQPQSTMSARPAAPAPAWEMEQVRMA